MMEYMISALLGLIVGAAVIYFYMKKVNESKVNGAKQQSLLIIDEAKREAEALKKEALLKRKMKLTNFELKQKKTSANAALSFRNKKTGYCKEKKILIARMML